MSKILLVHPYKMLQHAFVIALFPDHEVKIVEDLSAAQAAAEDADIAIVDTAALRSRGLIPADEIWAPKDWRLPTIWIDTEKSPRDPSSGMTRLIPPLTRERLKTAVADLLHSAARPDSAVQDPRHSTPPKTTRKEKVQASKDSGDKKIIELVEVFDEEDDREKTQAGPRE